MVDEEHSESENNENCEKSNSEGLGNSSDGGGVEMSAYEKQRLSRIRENKARLEALGLPTLASSLLRTVEKTSKRKGKRKDEDDEYIPSDGDRGVSSSSEEDNEEEDWKVGDDGSSGYRRASTTKGKKNATAMGKSKKKAHIQKHAGASNLVDDDDDDILKAIALSLEGSPETSGAVPPGHLQNSTRAMTSADLNEQKGGAHIQEDSGRRKRRKMNSSRVQMTEDAVIIHFFQFDEAGKGNISFKDLRRVAVSHDFTWTDKEIADMIHTFDSDGDGKLSLEDFRKIVYRCNMIQGCENAVTGLKS
ncbi:PREDICTED: centrin-1-like [Nelumbo nucifera]|uniref:Centrin-1-like n=2 Tax=Nelumbo nucifera TaxID=4432 RepID=A0A1U8ANZ4_NELNU|nr:PREDICTED: centrin-1-like [Nelumbo nucifera]DAD18535.1 TPA_asm: hypothetical protein HUJ06_019998 [Nelumbo nucifera]